MNEDITNILNRYFEGLSSVQENKMVSDWLEENPDHKSLLEEYRRIWEITGKITYELHPDIDEEWKNFKLELQKAKTKTNSKVVSIIKRYKLLQIAAIFILGIILVTTITNDSYSIFNHGLISISTTNTKKNIQLEDGSTVWLNVNSSIKYPKQFKKSHRKVTLDGEAYFEIKKDETKPFVIHCNNTQVEVLGTAFNLRSDNTNDHVEIIVVEGKVKFSTRKRARNNVILERGEKGIFIGDKSIIKKDKNQNINFLAWKNEQLQFNNQPLREVIPAMENYFNVEIKSSNAINNCKFTGTFNKPKLDELLQIISVSININYEQSNGSIILVGEGCN